MNQPDTRTPNQILPPKEPGKPLFSSKGISATRGIKEAFPQLAADHDPTAPRPALFDCLDRHFSGDGGDLDEHDTLANLDALFSGARVFSVYHLPEGKIYIITDAQDDEGTRQMTTMMFPSEY